jgi:hypothetical protein
MPRFPALFLTPRTIYLRGEPRAGDAGFQGEVDLKIPQRGIRKR